MGSPVSCRMAIDIRTVRGSTQASLSRRRPQCIKTSMNVLTKAFKTSKDFKRGEKNRSFHIYHENNYVQKVKVRKKMTLETSIAHLIDVGSYSYSVKTTRDEAKLVKFELVKNALPNSESSFNYQWLPDTNLFVLDSIHSGVGRNDQNDLADIVVNPILQLLKVPFKYVKSADKDSIRHFAKTYLEPSADHSTKRFTIIFLSGDTSISEVLNGIREKCKTKAQSGIPLSNVDILPLPMGTANALSNSLGLKCPIHAFSQFLRKQMTASPLPLYNVTFPDDTSTIFFIIFSMGFHANLLHKCNDPAYQGMGIERFQIASSEILENYELDQSITVSSRDPDFEPLTASYSYFALINVPNLEICYIPSPKSNPLKSELHLLGYFSGIPRNELIQKIRKGYSSKLGDDIMESGTIYKSIHSGIEVSLPTGEITKQYKHEICCDGLLYNLSEFRPVDASRVNKIYIKPINGSIVGEYIINILN